MRFSMPFPEKEEARQEACRLALCEGANRRELCRRFQISAKTLYKWLDRYRSEGMAGLSDRSRRPHRSPLRTGEQMEAAVLAIRHKNPVWGGRKIAASLRRQGLSPPCPSTITSILHRHDMAFVAAGQKPWKRLTTTRATRWCYGRPTTSGDKRCKVQSRPHSSAMACPRSS